MAKAPESTAWCRPAEKQKAEFIVTIEGYNAAVKQKGRGVELSIHKNHTWEDIVILQKQAYEEQELQHSKGVGGFLRKAARGFGRNTASFEAWLKLLPKESHYLSVLCGGLKLVLGV